MFRIYRNGLIAGFGLFTALVLCLTVAWAADILTVDKDGTIRLRVSDTGATSVNATDNTSPALTVMQNGSDSALEVTGDLTWDGNYLYIKTAAGWKRAALATW